MPKRIRHSDHVALQEEADRLRKQLAVSEKNRHALVLQVNEERNKATFADIEKEKMEFEMEEIRARLANSLMSDYSINELERIRNVPDPEDENTPLLLDGTIFMSQVQLNHFLLALLGYPAEYITRKQAMYLCNLPPRVWGSHFMPFYDAMVKYGMKSFFPIDHQKFHKYIKDYAKKTDNGRYAPAHLTERDLEEIRGFK